MNKEDIFISRCPNAQPILTRLLCGEGTVKQAPSKMGPIVAHVFYPRPSSSPEISCQFIAQSTPSSCYLRTTYAYKAISYTYHQYVQYWDAHASTT